jgi:periplasmic divalent cation tolerance protein
MHASERSREIENPAGGGDRIDSLISRTFRAPLMEPIVVLITTLPDAASARALAEALVRERLAACVNLMAECTSIYHWQGAVETAAEVPLWIKTSAALYPRVEQFIRTHHPYDLPEVIALPLAAGLAPYLQWVEQETQQPQPDSEHS